MSDAVRLVLDVSEREHGERLDRLIAARVTGVSRSFAQTLMKSGDVLVNGQPDMSDAVRLVLDVSEREHGERLDRLIAARVTGV
ncbi:hypothetical protein F1715_11680, partial [Streptococcus pneumoniae]